jgi:hypothetical protein
MGLKKIFKKVGKIAGPVLSVAGAVTGNPLLAAAGQVAGGIAGSSAAKKAANAQVAAAQQAADLQKEMYYKNIELQAPFREAGLSAQNKLLDYMGLTPGAGGKYTKDFSMQDFQQDPGYAFRMSEGLKALDRTAAARGGMLSGAALRGATRFGQDMASQEYTNAFNRYQTNRANQLNPLQSLMGAGQTAAGNVANAGQNYANQAGEAYMGAGNARASGYVGSANAWNSALGGAANTLSQQNMLGSIFGNRGGSFVDPSIFGGAAAPGVSYFGSNNYVSPVSGGFVI